MNFTAAPAPVSFPKPQSPVAQGGWSRSVKIPKNDLSLKGGTPEANGGRDFPLPPPPCGTGRRRNKEIP